MLRPLLALLLTPLSLCVQSMEAPPASPAPSPPAEVRFEPALVDLGEIRQFSTIEHRFVLRNESDVAVELRGVVPASEHGRIVSFPRQVAAHGRGEVHVVQETGNLLGARSFRFGVVSDHPDLRERKLTLVAMVGSAYDPEIGSVNLGTIAAGEQPEFPLILGSREAIGLQVLAAHDVPDWMRVEFPDGPSTGQSVPVTLRVKRDAKPGFYQGVIRLETNFAPQPRFETTYRAWIQGGIIASVPSLDFGWSRVGEPTTVKLYLRSRDGSAVATPRMTTDSPEVELIDQSACGDDCLGVILRFSGREIGQKVGVVTLRFEDEPDPLPLPFAGLVVSSQTEVRSLGRIDEAIESSAAPRNVLGLIASDAAPAGPVSAALPPMGALVEGAAPVRLSWKARNEDGLYGYLVYRADRPAGPFRRDGRSIIRTVEVPDGVVAEHEFLDSDVEVGRTYYYYLDALERSGRKRRLSGILARRVIESAPSPDR